MRSEPVPENKPHKSTEACPVTGLPMHCRPEWTMVDCGDGFRSTVYVLQDDIVVCRPYGNATARAVEASLEIAKAVVREVVGLDRPYVKIEDYANLGRVPLEARKRFMEYVKSEPYLQRQIFCNLSNLMRISIKLGKRVAMIPVEVEIADDFAQAVQMARKIRSRDGLSQTRQSIRYSADPFAEYESAGLCPVSNLEIIKRPEWSDIRIGHGAKASLQWIGPRILHVTLDGNVEAEGIKSLIRHKVRAVVDWHSETEPYLEIINATSANIDQDSNLFSLFQARPQPRYRKAPVAGIVIRPVALYKTKAFLRRLLLPFSPRVLIVSDYREAVLKAVKTLSKLGYAHNASFKSFTTKEWELKQPGFTTHFEIINGNILHSSSSGDLETEEVSKLFEYHYRLIEQMRPPPGGYAFVADIRNVRSVSPAARKRYIEEILKQHRHHPISQFVFYGANPRFRAMVNLYRPLIPFPVKLVKDLESALKLLARPSLKYRHSSRASQRTRSETANLKRFADDLIQYMVSINWEEDGMDSELTKVDPLNPLRPAYEAIALIKMDLDYLHQERRKAECSLAESEKKYRTILDSINEGYFEMDCDHKLFYFNDATNRILGYSPAELMQTNLFDLLDPNDRASAERTLEEAKNRGISHKTIQWKYQRKDESRCHIEMSVTPILADDGKINGFRGLLRDITQRIESEEEKRRLEAQLQQAQKMEALGTLAGGVAHDLNNILTGLVTYPDIILQKLPPDSPLGKGLETIRNSGEKAATIVQDLLALARRGVATREILNLNRMIQDYLDSLEYANLRRYHPNIQAELDLAPDLLNIAGSSVHLSKTLMNLMSNAAEAMPDGGSIVISTRNLIKEGLGALPTELKEGEHVALTVSDSGIGISEEDRQRIFEPFYTKKIMGRSGTGLGMAVVWGTVKDHQGHITLTSEKNHGTEFTLYFPVDRSEPEHQNGPVPVQSYRGNGESILVVDDQALQRELLEEMLSELGYSTKTMENGEAAVAYMEMHSADLLILDMIMDPGIDGYETYRRICEHHPRQKAILCTGYSESERVRLALELGAGAYLKKPYSMEQLGLAVRNELDRHF